MSSLDAILGPGTLTSNIFGQLLNEEVFARDVRPAAPSEAEHRLRAAFREFLKAGEEDMESAARLSKILAELDDWLARAFEKHAPLEAFARGNGEPTEAFWEKAGRSLFHYSRWPLFTVIAPAGKSGELAFLQSSGLPAAALTESDKFFAARLGLSLFKFHAPPHREALRERLGGISERLRATRARIVHGEGIFTHPPVPRAVGDDGSATLRECRELLQLPLDLKLGKGVKLGICDTGIDLAHPAFAPHVKEKRLQYFVPEGMGSPDDRDPDYHGSHCAGIAAGGAEPNEGMAPAVNLLMARVFPPGQGGATNEMVKNGLRYLLDKKADIISLSLGSRSGPESELAVICSEITRRDIALVVGSAGNSGPHAGTVGAPGSGEHVLAVGALDKTLKVAPFSSRGAPGTIFEQFKKPSLVAIGVNVVAPKAGTDDYVPLSGTSMSCPMLAGLAAAKLSTFRAKGKKCTPTELKNLCLERCTRDGLKDDNGQTYPPGGKYNPHVGAGLPRGLVTSSPNGGYIKKHFGRALIFVTGLALGFGLGMCSAGTRTAPEDAADAGAAKLPDDAESLLAEETPALPRAPEDTAAGEWEALLRRAHAGDAGAQYRAGLHYGRGDFGPMDLGAAEHWLKKAADAGHAEAPEALEVIRLMRLREVFQELAPGP